jgi:dolichyl-diphosphooligosaccharide--protein glycosyltransferase
MVAVAVVVLIAVGSGAYLYTSHSFGVFPSTSTSTSSGFANAPCTPSTSTSSSGTNGTYALICTNLGLIEVQLFPSAAPKTVANFVSLANSGFYNDLVWHRIVAGFVIQAGDPTTKNGGGNRSLWGTGTSGTTIPLELNSTLHNAAGYLAMAAPSSGNASSQFYINLADNSASLDTHYAVFGNVINGMSVVQAIAKVQVNTGAGSPELDQPVTPSDAYIVSITIQNTP